jgi:hypothetical protein
MPVLGVIEGFYGRPWSHNDRLFLITRLRALGLAAYLYAPKADASLRRDWKRAWTTDQQREFRELTDAGIGSGATVSAGLSPFELYRAYDAAARDALKMKVGQILDCGFSAIALLFDDMPGEVPDLALRQAEIINDVSNWTPGMELRVCPTYYSDDPVLDRVFGNRPQSYLEDLSSAIDGSVPLFWTGPEVCSAAITAAHLERVAAKVGAPLALWDNYPVNDSKVRSEHLYVQEFEKRESSPAVESHWSNAMNQMALSLPALASLPAVYGLAPDEAAEVLSEAGLSQDLVNACSPLADTARDSLSPREHEALTSVGRGDTRAAAELRAWLDGEYRFDPACLTD